MIPRTPFQQFLPPRIEKARLRLRDMIWQVDGEPLAVSRSPAGPGYVDAKTADGLKYRPVRRLPHTWGKLFDQCWWKLRIPRGAGRSRYLVWRDQAEATLYIGGRAHYGLDLGHPYAPLPDRVTQRGGEVMVESACCRTGIWISGETEGVSSKGSIFQGAFLATRDEDAWHAYHDLEVLLELAIVQHRAAFPLSSDIPDGNGYREPIEVVSPAFRRLIDQLDRAVDALDHGGPAALRWVLQKTYAALPAAPDALRATLTGHAHIDLVWLWPERVGVFKAVHSFANVLSLQDRYPELVFGYSQPASYEAVGQRSPETLRRVKRAVADGHWEPTGAMYVESDTQLACGEALVRAFALGQNGFRKLRGEDSRAVWLPDVFGYSGVIPTLMAGFGVPYFFTTKMHWSSATRFPHSSFKWRGNDGSEVLAHLSWKHYNQENRPAEFDFAAQQHRQSAVHHEVLIPTGYGDGGGGPTESMCERARRVADLAGMPRCKWGTIEGFFDRLAEVSGELPAWRGEMYLEYHRGVQTTHGQLKSAFRAAERGLQAWEAVRCARQRGPIDKQPWKRVVFAQFHDYIPGSSIRAVYDEALPELERLAADTAAHAKRELADQRATAKPCLFNPLPLARTVRRKDKQITLAPLAGVALRDAEKDAIVLPKVKVGDRRLENDRLAVRFNAVGEVAAMRVDGRKLAFDSPAGALWTFPDHPANYDAWDIDRPAVSNGKRVTGRAELEIDAADPWGPVLRFTRRIGKDSRATVSYTLDACSAMLRIDIDLDWREPQTLLKLAVPTAYRGANARFGAPFGSQLRPQLPGSLTADAMFEVPGSRWAAVADDTEREGVVLITRDKYGFGAHDGLLHVSLVRSSLVTKANSGGGNDSAAAAVDDMADLGRHRIGLAMGRYSADLSRGQNPAALADTLFTPPISYRGAACSAGLLAVEDGESLVPCWSQPLGRGAWVLRLHETLGQRGTARLRLAPGYTATPIDLREQTQGKAQDRAVRVEFAGYQVLSFRIERGREA
ncbi:MAG: glycoside hydrolase family 38 C-terminal domain-containing protein [Planctomycetota bacterium]